MNLFEFSKNNHPSKKTDQQKSIKDERHLDDNMEVETDNEVDESDLEGDNNIYYIHDCQILTLV